MCVYAGNSILFNQVRYEHSHHTKKHSVFAVLFCFNKEKQRTTSSRTKQKNGDPAKTSERYCGERSNLTESKTFAVQTRTNRSKCDEGPRGREFESRHLDHTKKRSVLVRQ